MYEGGAGRRSSVLDRARRFASLAKPHVLPPDGQSKNTDLPENYQSIGSRGISALVGKSLIALWSFGTPFFQHKPAGMIMYDPNVATETKRQLQTMMLGWDMTLMSMLESSGTSDVRRSMASFRSRKRTVLEQLYVTGDCLERMDDDFRIQVFRRDQYITRRDDAGWVIDHITCELVDPRAMVYNMRTGMVGSGTNAEFLEQCELPVDIADKDVDERMQKMFTHIDWNPESKRWVIRQECNGKIFNTVEETVSPYFSTAFNLPPGEDYGRGIIEENDGDLRSLDEISHRRLDLLALASKGLIVKDENSMMRDVDLEQESGKVIHGRVKGGVVDDVALLNFAAVREFNMINEGIKDLSLNLARAFLLESASQPDGERVTAYQVRRIANEIDSALGGSFAPISDQQQLPMVARMDHIGKKKGLIPNFPGNAVNVEITTGIAAMSRDLQFAKGVELAQIMAQMPEAAQQRINWSIFAERLFELRAFLEPGIVKTDADIKREAAAAMKQAMAAKAGEQAIESTGAIAENVSKQQPTNQGG